MIGFPSTTYETLDGKRYALLNTKARMVLVNLWASWCAPCVEELKGFATDAARLRSRGVDVVALSVDAVAEPDSAERTAELKLLEQIKFPFRTGRADRALVTKLQMLNDTIFEVRNPLPLPTSFLVDKKRRVLIVYKGPVSVDELLADVQRIRVKSTDEWRAVAVPFQGQWIMTPKRRHLFSFVEQLIEQGFVDEARDYVRRNEAMFTTHPRWPQLQQKLILPRR
jgi:peroxiredoxin